MKRMVSIILILILGPAPVYAEEKKDRNYKGMWTCKSENSFRYYNGEIRNLRKPEFSIEVHDRYVYFIDITIPSPNAHIRKRRPLERQDRNNQLELLAYDSRTLLAFHEGNFAITSIEFNLEPITFNHIGACKRVNRPK